MRIIEERGNNKFMNFAKFFANYRNWIENLVCIIYFSMLLLYVFNIFRS